jgi:hypothetical protein
MRHARPCLIFALASYESGCQLAGWPKIAYPDSASYLLYDPRIECSNVVSEKHSQIAIELVWWVPVRSAGAWATLPLLVEDEMLARMVRGECSSTCRFTLAKTRPVFGKNNIGRRLPENRVS